MAEAIITLPDGRRAKLTGPSREAILRQAQQSAAPSNIPEGEIIPRQPMRQASIGDRQQLPGIPATEMSTVTSGAGIDAWEAGARAAGSRLLGNIAEIPNVAANALLNVPNPLSNLPPDSPARQRMEQARPALGARTIPTPRGEQIMAALETALEAPGTFLQQPTRDSRTGERSDTVSLSDLFGENLADAEALAREHPTATDRGEMIGDIATILTGRRPLARGRAPAMRAQREAIEREARERLDMIPEELKEQLSDVVTRNVGAFVRATPRRLKSFGRKATETGLEGATLALLNEGDPETMFWFGVGGQAVGSGSLFFAEKPVKRLLPAVALSWLGSEMIKAAGPGGQDFFGSKDFAVQRVNAALALGLTSALAGSGRLRGKAAENYPAIFDAITATPRAAILSRLQEVTNESEAGNELPLRIMERYAEQPGFFSEAEQEALGRALTSERVGAFTQEIERLMDRSRDFRERVGRLSSSKQSEEK